jgi:hypothetical protein
VSTEVDATAVVGPVRPNQNLGPLLCDVEAIALLYRVARGTVRRWASEDRWTPYGTRRYRKWDLRQAEGSAAARSSGSC